MFVDTGASLLCTWCGWAVASLLLRCCGGPFAGGRPSVFQRSQSLLVRWVDVWGCGVLRFWARSSRTNPEDGSGHEGSRLTGTCIGERGTRSLTVSLLTVPQPGHLASFRPGATLLPLASPRPHIHRTARTPLLFYGPFLYRPSTNLPQVCTGLVLIFTKFSSL